MVKRKRRYIKLHRKNWDSIFKLFRALLNSSGVQNLLFALLKSFSSRYSLCLVKLEIISGFRETTTSPLVHPYGSSFRKQHIQYQGDLYICISVILVMYKHYYCRLCVPENHINHITWFFATALLYTKHENWTAIRLCWIRTYNPYKPI